MATVWERAKRDALHGGLPGMFAMAMQVTSLMWLRTTVNFQYAHGTTTRQAFRTLYAQGGMPRFYQGFLPALVQAPLSRFGDTAANAGMLALLQGHEQTSTWPIAVQTFLASVSAACFRILLMPIDTLKTVLQVNGAQGWSIVRSKVAQHGPSTLFHGSLASSAATFAGHYPWFTTYNYLTSRLPEPTELYAKLVRSAAIGFCCSIVSDTVSNSMRVIKTTRQASPTSLSYRRAVHLVLAKDGVMGLLGRGLKTKILTNGIQGLMFSVLWRAGQDYMSKREDAHAAKK